MEWRDITWRTAFKTVFVVGALWMIGRSQNIFLPIIMSMVLAFILNPLVNALSSMRLPIIKRPMHRSLAIVIAFLLSIVLLAGIVTYILVPFIHEFNKLVTNIPSVVQKAQLLFYEAQRQYGELDLPENYRNMLEQGVSRLAAFFVNLFQNMLVSLVHFTTSIVELVVVPFLTFYFLKDWPAIRHAFLQLFSVRHREKIAEILEESGWVISSYIRGQITVSLIMGALVFIMLSIFGVDYPMVIALLAGLTETIPVVGPIIGALPALVFAAVSDPALAIKVAIGYVVIHQLESHVIVPMVMGRSINLHPVTVILAVLIGSQLLGFAGMIIATPVAALLKVLYKQIWDLPKET